LVAYYSILLGCQAQKEPPWLLLGIDFSTERESAIDGRRFLGQDGRIMKTLLVGFLLCGMAWAADKPYADLPIVISSTRVDANGLLRIEARDKNNILKVKLAFTCRVRVELCSSLLVSPKVYWLTAGSPIATCDEYVIDEGKKPIARVCLIEARPVSPQFASH
jgi:hypothetical protein